MKTISRLQPILVAWIAVTLSQAASADEGMWLFNDLPKEHLKTKYGFEPSDEWAQHVMLSSVRFNSGGSASFVSSTGLVLTNHHVGADTLHKVSTPEHNYYRDGFLAKTTADEIEAPDLELNQLVSVDDVTERVNGAVKSEMSTEEAFAARRAVMSEIEKESLDKTGLRSDVVTLYGGARYHLYRYKKYTDVRLVWAPESGIAFFGGDADNFEYPRYCLDVCLFRVYEDDKPAKIEHFLKVSEKGAADGEVVFVPGNPGRTQRIFTSAALKYQRDRYVPYVLDFLRRREILYQQFGLEGEEQERQARDDLFGTQNARKAYTGMIQGLQNPVFLARKQEEEAAIRAKVENDPDLKKYADAWKTIEGTQARRADALGQTAGFAGRHYSIAETLVFMAAEDQKPNAKRLRQYRESARASLEQQLFSPAPIHADLERLKFADSLALLVERRGGDHPLVQKVLDGNSPQARAAELVGGTGVTDVEFRRKLAKGGQAAIDASTDPMIRLAKLMEPEARRARKINDELDELERQAYSQITTAVYAVKGTETYPDATFTLRLAFGPVRGYVEGGQAIPPWTTIAGAFEHEKNHGAKEPWELPAKWHARKDQLDSGTPFNFVCTADIIGGNSGSPVINRKAELVGVIFDGNIQSLTSRYFYSDKVARAVSVHSSVVLESLRKIYDAGGLADELGK
ncbi:MAG: S46 family peptidase [Planctomycetes bacterium]|nr:S46 family peptidase [Planctomycetota bacterium]MBL7039925.1 S46 family peptidase [Pirellulaceae bacterium]